LKHFLFVLVLVAQNLLAGQPLYVVGEDYVLFSESNQSTVLERGILPRSMALDPDRCRLWITTDSDSQLKVFEKGIEVSSSEYKGRIVSEFNHQRFVTVSSTGDVQFRDSQGEVLFQFQIENSESLVKLAILSNDESWGLLQQPNRSEKSKNDLWITRISRDGKITKKLPLDPAEEFWGKVQFFVDEFRKRIWIGYARASAHHAYAPKVEKLNLEGGYEGTFQWDERGFFFDGCIDPVGDFILARDLPSSPYTVPDYSFIEKIKGQGKLGELPQRVLELETSRLVDSMSCQAKSIFFATHSIFGSEPKKLLVWSGNTNQAPEDYLNLPGIAKKVFICNEPTH